MKSLCMSLKMEAIVRLAKEALAAGKAVVIGLQSTGEAAIDHSFDLDMEKGEQITQDYPSPTLCYTY